MDIFWSASGEGTVAYEAHLGGYFWSVDRCPAPLAGSFREPYDLFTMGKQARRRQVPRTDDAKPMSDRIWDARAWDGRKGPKPGVSARGEAEMKARAVHRVHRGRRPRQAAAVPQSGRRVRRSA